MYSLMIVEDEPVIREGLANTVDWPGLGYKVTAAAGNGYDAFQSFRRDPTDVVLTDIRMPEYDGVWLLKKIREIRPESQVIFISSYSEFEYARQAVEYHVFSYIMKFDLFDRLEETFLKLRDVLDEQTRNRAINLRNSAEANRGLLTAALRRGIWSEVMPDAGMYRVVCIPAPADFPRTEHRLLCAVLQNTLAVLLYANDRAELAEHEKNFLIWLREAGIIKQPAFGPAVRMKEEVTDSYYAAAKLLDRVAMEAPANFPGKPAVFTDDFLWQNEGPSIRWPADSLARDFTVLPLRVCMEKIREFLEDCVMAAGFNATDCRAHLLSVFQCIAERYGQTGAEAIRRIPAPLLETDSMLALEAPVLDLAKFIRAKLAAENRGGVSVDAVLAYVDRYFQRDLQLKNVAGYFHVSAPYLSALIKKHTGKGFTDYLKHRRLLWAAHLLETTGRTVVSIARDVGYGDVKHFTRLFKVAYGRTPSNWRKTAVFVSVSLTNAGNPE